MNPDSLSQKNQETTISDEMYSIIYDSQTIRLMAISGLIGLVATLGLIINSKETYPESHQQIPDPIYIPDTPAGSFIYETSTNNLLSRAVPVKTVEGCVTAAQTIFDHFNMTNGICLGSDGESLGQINCSKGQCVIHLNRQPR